MAGPLRRIPGLFALGLALLAAAALWAGPPLVSAARGADATPGPARSKPPRADRTGDKEAVVEMSLAGGYSPQRVEIRTGTTVVWRNVEPTDYPVVRGRHQVVADDSGFASPQVEPGSSWAKTFLKPGTYRYHCGNHLHMSGTVIVKGQPISPEQARREKTVDIVEPDPEDEDTWGYKPADLTIEVGTEVTWRNTGAQEHTATSDDGEFNSGTLESGESFSFTFEKPGVFDYHCKPHPWMTAKIRVAAPGKAPPPDTGDSGGSSSTQPPPPPPAKRSDGGPTTHHVNIVEGSSTDTWGFDPETLQVRVGDTVVWTNTGSVDHTATEDNGAFDSGPLGSGDSFEHTFDEVGTYRYHCEPHPFMKATVVVSKNAPPPSSASSGGRPAAADAPPVEEPQSSDSGQEPAPAEGAVPALAPGTDERLVALLLLGVLAAACAAFLVGRWWGQAMHRVERPVQA